MSRYIANSGPIKIFEVALGRQSNRSEKGNPVDESIPIRGPVSKIVAVKPISPYAFSGRVVAGNEQHVSQLANGVFFQFSLVEGCGRLLLQSLPARPLAPIARTMVSILCPFVWETNRK